MQPLIFFFGARVMFSKINLSTQSYQIYPIGRLKTRPIEQQHLTWITMFHFMIKKTRMGHSLPHMRIPVEFMFLRSLDNSMTIIADYGILQHPLEIQMSLVTILAFMGSPARLIPKSSSRMEFFRGVSEQESHPKLT